MESIQRAKWQYLEKLMGLMTICIFLFSSSCTEEKTQTPSAAVSPNAAVSAIPASEPPPEIVKEMTKTASNKFVFKYDLENPSHSHKLPKKLLEISALSYDEKRNNLLAVNDERADIYVLDAKDCKVKKDYDFGKKGDYEGVEIIGNMVYVVKSNGTIFPFDLATKKKADSYKTRLSEANDVEGLAYDKKKNALILACKGAPNLEKQPKLKKTKAFYSFDLTNETLIEQPKFVITDDQLDDFFEQHSSEEKGKKSKKKLRNRLKSFSPSAIAQHPTEDFFYILSSVGRLLVVCDDQGAIQAIQFLNDQKFSQPEGICFAPDGTMYISNEGRSLVANILTFSYQ